MSFKKYPESTINHAFLNVLKWLHGSFSEALLEIVNAKSPESARFSEKAQHLMILIGEIQRKIMSTSDQFRDVNNIPALNMRDPGIIYLMEEAKWSEKPDEFSDAAAQRLAEEIFYTHNIANEEYESIYQKTFIRFLIAMHLAYELRLLVRTGKYDIEGKSFEVFFKRYETEDPENLTEFMPGTEYENLLNKLLFHFCCIYERGCLLMMSDEL